MSLTLLSPYWLWLLAVAPLIWLLRGDAVPVRVAVLRSVAVALFVFALSKPVLVQENQAQPIHVVVVDGSEAANDVAQSVGRNGDGHEVVVVEIGDSKAIGAALQEAARLIATDRDGLITVVTDGLATDTTWQRAVSDLVHRNIPIHVVAVDRIIMGTRITRLLARSELRVGQVASFQVTTASQGARGRVELSIGGHAVAESEIIDFNGEITTALELEPSEPGFVDVTARFVAVDNEAAQDTELTRTFPVQRPLTMVYLGGRLVGSDSRWGDLLGAGFEIKTSTGEDASVLNGADLVVIDDCKASAVPVPFQEALTAAVTQRGLGLIVSGGRAAFGPGGYHDTPIEKILPVEFIQKEEKKDPSTALAVIIDTSGSMGGNRIRLAKEVARLAIRRLLPHDKVGIVEFYGAKRWAAPLQSAANAIDIQRALNRLDAGGGTVLLPAVEEAFYGLKNVKTRYKHCLLLTDAGVESGPYESLMRRMAKDGICVSTVLVGPGRHSEFLVELASWGNGRYYNASNRFNLPEVMLKQPSTSRLPAWRTGAFSVSARGGPRWWGGSTPRSVPVLDGYVETRAQPGSLTLMETNRDHHPVLATWRHGLGRVTAFMSEPTGTGTKTWNAWSGYGSLLGQVCLATASGSRESRRRFRVDRNGGTVTVTATGGMEGVVPTVQRNEQDGLNRKVLKLRRRAIYSYSGQLFGNGEATVCLTTGDGTYLVSDALDVRRPQGQVPAALGIPLRKLSSLSGGSYRRATDPVIAETARVESRGRTARVLWPWLLLSGLLVYLAEIFIRRSVRPEVKPS